MDVLTGRVDHTEKIIGELRAVRARHGCLAQVFDADYVAGREHLSLAIRLTRRAIERETTIADTPSMEVLLYVAGTRQIERAMRIGIGPDTDRAVVVLDGDDVSAAAEEIRPSVDPIEDGLVPRPEAIREWFGISAAEGQATNASLEELVCERVALLQLEA